jgi:signal transduction histidine kinase
MQDLELTSMLGIILPALISAQVISLVIGVGIGMFSSRKAAVPVYKLEKWATQIKRGRLKTHLGFRETHEMKDLTIQCNALADTYRTIFKEIDDSLETIASDRIYKSQVVTQQLLRLKEILDTIDYKD